MLETRYSLNKNWTNGEIKELAKRLEVPFAKIYKWHWERKKKDQKDTLSIMRLRQMIPVAPLIEQHHQKRDEESDNATLKDLLDFC